MLNQEAAMLLTYSQCETVFRVDRLRLYLARYVKPRSISSLGLVAGDGGSDLRWVNDTTDTKLSILTVYFPKLISRYHCIGLYILPPINKFLFM